MRVLITGLLPHDSGKTTFAKSLLESAVEIGVDAGFCKPISGINGWYQFDCISKSLEMGLLVGEDMIKLHEASESSDPIEYEGPVVSLLLPPDPERTGWRTDVYFSLLNQVSVVRVLKEHYYVPSNVERCVGTLKEYVEDLIKSVKAKEVDASYVANVMVDSRILADRCLEYLRGKHELFVIESYNNCASPTEKSLEVDLVVVVAPGKAVVFRGEDYRTAMATLSSFKEPWTVTTESVVSVLNPISTIDVDPKRPNVLDRFFRR